MANLVLGLCVTVFWERGIHFWGVKGYLSSGIKSSVESYCEPCTVEANFIDK